MLRFKRSFPECRETDRTATGTARGRAPFSLREAGGAEVQGWQRGNARIGDVAMQELKAACESRGIELGD